MREAVSAVAVIALCLTLASVAMPRFRSGARLPECIDNQREMSAGSAAFALSNNDLFAGLMWLRGDQSSQWADIRTQANQISPGPHAAQVVDFLRRRGLVSMPTISSWFSDHWFTTIALVEFLNKDLTDPFNVCPSDAHQLAWRLDPAGFNAGAFLPLQPPGGAGNARWPYASSYIASAAAINPLRSDPGVNPSLRLAQGDSQSLFNVPGGNPSRPVPALDRRAPIGEGLPV